MSQIARRRRKGRPSKADLAARRSSSSPRESGYELRRGQRQRNVRYNFDFDDYFDEEEEDEVEEEKKRQKKLKQVLKLNQSRARADPPVKSRARVRHASDYEEEDEEDDEAEEEEEEVSEKRQVKKRKLNRQDEEEEEEEEKDYDVEEEEEEEEGHADSEEEDDKERKRRSASGNQCDHSSETTPILDKKSLELILDKLQKKDIYGVYAEPVDPEELPDYHDMIEHPMDFSTVRKKLANGSYSTLEELESDVLLICSNAMQYNSSDTVYYKQARTIQEMGKRKFEKARLKIKRAEKELKTDEKVKPDSSVKKQVRQPFSRNGLEAVGSDFSSGANLASGGASQNEPVSTQIGGHEKHSYTDVLFEGNTSLVDSLEKAEDLSSGKGLFGKCGRKLSVVEEDRRATYEDSDQQGDRSESIFTTFESEIKQFVAVGLHAEHAYGRSLARFAATLGPVAWKIASQRIEQALPADFKFGRGWVGEYEPLPTPVLLFETCTPKEPPKKASVFSKRKSNAATKTNETLFKTPLPAKEQQGSRPVRDGNHAFPFPASIGALSEGSPSFVATQVGNLKSMSQHEYRNPSQLDFVKPQNRIPQQVELNLPPPAEQTNSGSGCVLENQSFGKSDTVASYRSSSDMMRNMSSTDSEHYKHQMTTDSQLDFVKPQNRIPQQVELNLPPPAEQTNSGSGCVLENQSFGKSDTVASYRSSSDMMRNMSSTDSEHYKHQMTTNGIFPGGLRNGKVSPGVNNRMFDLSTDFANQMSRTATSSQQPMRQQSQSHEEQAQIMRNFNERARTQHNSTYNHPKADAPPKISSPQSARSEDSGNASVAAARAWMSIGAGGNNKQTFENASNPKSSQISAESLYNPSREHFHQQAFKPRDAEETQFHPQRNGFPFQTFVHQPVHGMMNGGYQPFQNNRPIVFPQMAAPTSDFSRFHVQSQWRGGITPQVQLKQRQENFNLPPDLNIGVHSPDSPAKQSSGVRVDSQQPDLALQL
ncbi:unnamed protein product [Arabidopsis thaliana]|uniref:Bromo domain-containing protein n=1 Tax=Arabidopsis thaliana TaxID=3702 RepID=A0A654GB08_ARATH|nr:unnamed protein product [Arabidopsis thaliana]